MKVRDTIITELAVIRLPPASSSRKNRPARHHRGSPQASQARQRRAGRCKDVVAMEDVVIVSAVTPRSAASFERAQLVDRSPAQQSSSPSAVLDWSQPRSTANALCRTTYSPQASDKTRARRGSDLWEAFHVAALPSAKSAARAEGSRARRAQAVQTGNAEIVVAGGMESMTNAPYLLPQARQGYRLGNGALIDSVINDGLWDHYNDQHMGISAENVAKALHPSRVRGQVCDGVCHAARHGRGKRDVLPQKSSRSRSPQKRATGAALRRRIDSPRCLAGGTSRPSPRIQKMALSPPATHPV